MHRELAEVEHLLQTVAALIRSAEARDKDGDDEGARNALAAAIWRLADAAGMTRAIAETHDFGSRFPGLHDATGRGYVLPKKEGEQ